MIVDGGRLCAEADRVRAILDAVGARDYLVWVALQERERALRALAPCSGEAGVAALTAYTTAIFARMNEATRQVEVHSLCVSEKDNER